LTSLYAGKSQLFIIHSPLPFYCSKAMANVTDITRASTRMGQRLSKGVIFEYPQKPQP
jgi:hypothetical protein